MSVYNAIRYNNSYANAGGLVLLTTNTASSSASVSFTSGIDSTYSEYLFLFNNIHPANAGAQFEFNFSTDGGSNYNVTKTSTAFESAHNEADTVTNLAYATGADLAQSTSYQHLAQPIGADNDQAVSGYLHLFEPSSDTFVKHFIAVINNAHTADYTVNHYMGGYGNTTSVVDAINFKMNTGNIDAGTIQMFGVVK